MGSRKRGGGEGWLITNLLLIDVIRVNFDLLDVIRVFYFPQIKPPNF